MLLFYLLSSSFGHFLLTSESHHILYLFASLSMIKRPVSYSVFRKVGIVEIATHLFDDKLLKEIFDLCEFL